jgi:hypothetical protein
VTAVEPAPARQPLVGAYVVTGMADVVAVLRPARVARRLTQADVYRRMGRKPCSTPMARYETLGACPSVEVLLDWAATLGYDLALVPRDGVR